MKNLKNYIFESTVTESKIDIDELIAAVSSAFDVMSSNSRRYGEGLDILKELKQNDFNDILDYYDGWKPVCDYLDIDEDECFNIFSKLSTTDIKKINKAIKNEYK
jgi:hypothetical protein